MFYKYNFFQLFNKFMEIKEFRAKFTEITALTKKPIIAHLFYSSYWDSIVNRIEAAKIIKIFFIISKKL